MSEANTFSIPAAEAGTAVCLVHAAPLLSASLRRLGVSVTDEVAVVGFGPQGLLGVKLAKALGAQVTVLGLAADQREQARRLGADAFITLTGPEAFAAHAGRFRAILNAAPDDYDDAAYLSLLEADGLIVHLGSLDERSLLAA
ncbi:MAG: zinc-binding dehydrogenase [Candidatus Sericytochromatia bacterium]